MSFFYKYFSLYPEQPSYGLCFSGGGVLGICHAGVISHLSKHNVINKFSQFSGASAGSIAATLTSFRCTSEFITETLSQDFSAFLDDDYGVVRDCNRLWYEKGYYKGDKLHSFLGEIFAKATGKENITFLEAHEMYNTVLVIPVTKVYKECCEVQYLSYKTSPDMNIADACRFSCTYPLLFRSLNNFSDGGILDNNPVECLESSIKYSISFEHKYTEKTEPQNAYEYISSIISSVHSKANECKTGINLKISVDISSTDFSITEQKKQELFSLGEKCAEKIIL